MSDVERLKSIGFESIGSWEEDQRYPERLAYGGNDAAGNIKAKLRVASALYAFVQGSDVRYIGKTARSISKRFVGYCNPANGKATNYRCHMKIKDGLKIGKKTEILIFVPISELNYGEFQIDLAAALEESLIRRLNPPWNGGDGRPAISEDAEREILMENDDRDSVMQEEAISSGLPPTENQVRTQIVDFRIDLGKTYYNHGFINPGVAMTNRVGRNDEPVRIYLGSWDRYVDSKINRDANPNESPRFVGNNRNIADWFQSEFKMGDVVEASVIDPNTVFLHPNHA